MSKTQWGEPILYRQRRIWFVPALWVILAIVLGVFLNFVNLQSLSPNFTTVLMPGVLTPYLSSIASGMMALTAIVFSLAFVFLQFGSSAYSPRLVSLFTTDRVVTNALGVFTGTFLFALVGLLLLNPNRPPLSDWTIAAVSFLWLLASVLLFVLLVRRINNLTIAVVLHMVGEHGRTVVEGMYPLAASNAPGTDESAHSASPVPATELAPISQTLRYVGGPAVVVEFRLSALAELARQAEGVIEIKYAVGDVVADGSPVLYVHGGQHAISENALREAIALGFERTIEQDPKYALRLLVDVGIKALSPAVNDPTTAVMALNEIDDLLRRLGRSQLDVGYVRDAAGSVRVAYPTPSWEDLLSLAIDEIRFYGANSYQIVRRLRALLADLEPIVPKERRAAIQEQRARLETLVNRTFVDALDLHEAQQSDRQGIGLSRRMELEPIAEYTPG
ncbi:MAG: DUF2254 domain-containing protein [Chloroflexota bacterium]|nr:MAG: DUF2254 domain-containing protein [Chloroflexota bacterium]